jgi:hypothetical protein
VDGWICVGEQIEPLPSRPAIAFSTSRHPDSTGRLGASFRFRFRVPASPPLFVASQTTEKTTPLETGKRIEQELSAGQKHDYEIAHREQYTSLTVEQRGIDVVVRLFGPDGRLNDDYDSVDGGRGEEDRSGLLTRKNISPPPIIGADALFVTIGLASTLVRRVQGKGERLARRARSFSVDR